MLVVDASVWVDFFRDAPRPHVEQLAQLLDHGEVRIVVPDLVLFEVLRGFRDERQHRLARRLLQGLSTEAACSPELAYTAAQHDRSLRAQGFKVRSPIDTLVATFCIEHDYALLHADRDFEAFESLRGLRVWRN